jgi:hypothetical protein
VVRVEVGVGSDVGVGVALVRTAVGEGGVVGGGVLLSVGTGKGVAGDVGVVVDAGTDAVPAAQIAGSSTPHPAKPRVPVNLTDLVPAGIGVQNSPAMSW